ncbi:MAG TPA: dihydropteroate synthase, partial [Verrucomicrobiales bacterium]|nr:dihydropteroate synthase [Verrucomicrobiales bacterium]
PGADPVTTSEELRRTIPIIEALRAEWDGLISIDTSKAEVAQKALAAGADIVNDVS